MVNEPHKIPNTENLDFEERLTASNIRVRQMQEEHRNLMQEMERLRARAAELEAAKLNKDNVQRLPQSQTVNSVESTNSYPAANVSNCSQENSLDPSGSLAGRNNRKEPLQDSNECQNENVDDINSPDYIKSKLSEIASLKAQLSRVKNMMETTSMIEQHLTSKTVSSEKECTADPNQKVTPEVLTSPPETLNATSGNDELFNVMLNTFNDITASLRTEADDLRAERARIKALKDKLIEQKKNQK